MGSPSPLHHQGEELFSCLSKVTKVMSGRPRARVQAQHYQRQGNKHYPTLVNYIHSFLRSQTRMTGVRSPGPGARFEFQQLCLPPTV